MSEHKPYILAVTGDIAAGKGTVIEAFKTIALGQNPNLKILSIRFSDTLRDGLNAIGIENPSREQLSGLSVWLTSKFGPASLARLVENKIYESQDYDLVTLDGMRWKADGEMVNNLPFAKSMIYVTGHSFQRYQRSTLRNEKAGDDKLTFEQFLAAHLRPTEQELRYILELSGYVIMNNNGQTELLEKVRNLYNRTFGSKNSEGVPLSSPLPLML